MTAVRPLFRQGHDVNAADADGTTALHWAVWADDEATVQELLRARATATVANTFRVTPLSIAAEHGNPAIVRRLLDAGRRQRTDASGQHAADVGGPFRQRRDGAVC